MIIILILVFLFLILIFRDRGRPLFEGLGNDIKEDGIIEEVDSNSLNKYGYDKDLIHEFSNFLSDEECDYIINNFRSNVRKSRVICDGGKYCNQSNSRTSSSTFVHDVNDSIVNNISQRISEKVGISVDNFEPLQVVNYKGGEEYKPHWDACVGEGRCSEFVKNGGDRYATFLLYLNDDFDGGETEFPLLGKKIKPEKGKGVLFYNLDDDNINYKVNSKHAGLPPRNGEKWMWNKWIRGGKWTPNMIPSTE